MKTFYRILRGIGQNGNEHIVKEYREGPDLIQSRVTQRFAFRGNRSVGPVTEEEQRNWLTLGRTTAEPPPDRFDPTQYPTEQCR